MLSFLSKTVAVSNRFERSLMSRSESKVEELVCEAILITNNISQAVIEIKDDDGIITLKGTVESEQDKLAAEALARQQEGVVDVINRLRVWVP
jgi:osmotically-inducible protein OsmY